MKTRIEKKINVENILVDEDLEPTIISRNRRWKQKVNGFRIGLFGSFFSQVIISYIINKYNVLLFLIIVNLIEIVLFCFKRSMFDIFKIFKRRSPKATYPCRGCLLLVNCTEFCSELTMKLQEIEDRFISERRCIDCGHERFNSVVFLIITPRGDIVGTVGPSALECRGCGHYFSFVFYGVQRVFHKYKEET